MPPFHPNIDAHWRCRPKSSIGLHQRSEVALSDFVDEGEEAPSEVYGGECADQKEV